MAYSPIIKPSTLMSAKLYTGNGGTLNVTGVGFQPDWTWTKRRDNTGNHSLYDSVRGVTKRIESDTTDAENTVSTSLTAFGTDGFTLGSGGDSNGNNETYASWNWKAGTSVSGNTTGSGTAKAYSGSVNTDAGFSIITYLGNGTAGHAIPHNLGVTPEIIITKRLSDAGEWYVYSPVMGNTKHMRLNQTGAEDTANTIWNNTSPTSSVFTVGTNADVNGSNNPIIAYSFRSVQGYSKMGEYTGNGNANGPFIFTGFKPAFVLWKKTSASGNWLIMDNKRSPINVAQTYLKANASAPEDATSSDIRWDFLSNGLKCRGNNSSINTSSATYTYMAFAEEPLVASNYNVATAQ